MALPDFEAWAIFATVVERRSFSGAADALGLSKATVSKAITRLETRLGVTLFHRTSRRLSLTDSGASLAERARALLAEGQEAEDCAREDAAVLAGRVRIAAPMSFGVTHVGPALARFMATHPRVAIDLDLSDATTDLVGQGFDLAVRIARLPDSTLRARKLRDVAFCLVAAPGYLEQHGTPRHPRDLAGHDLFHYAYARGEDVIALQRGRETISQRLTGRMRANNAEAMLPALIAGHGIAVLPDFIGAEARGDGRLVSLLDEWTLPGAALTLVTPPGRLRPRRVDLLIEFLASALLERR